MLSLYLWLVFGFCMPLENQTDSQPRRGYSLCNEITGIKDSVGWLSRITGNNCLQRMGQLFYLGAIQFPVDWDDVVGEEISEY